MGLRVGRSFEMGLLFHFELVSVTTNTLALSNSTQLAEGGAKTKSESIFPAQVIIDFVGEQRVRTWRQCEEDLLCFGERKAMAELAQRAPLCLISINKCSALSVDFLLFLADHRAIERERNHADDDMWLRLRLSGRSEKKVEDDHDQQPSNSGLAWSQWSALLVACLLQNL